MCWLKIDRKKYKYIGKNAPQNLLYCRMTMDRIYDEIMTSEVMDGDIFDTLLTMD
jgi:hypothetical protein